MLITSPSEYTPPPTQIFDVLRRQGRRRRRKETKKLRNEYRYVEFYQQSNVTITHLGFINEPELT